MKRRATPEHDLHKAVAAYLRVALKPPVFWTTFPAGGGGKARGGKLKGMGLKAGVPDILVIIPRETPPFTLGCVVVAIELKAPKGFLSATQTATRLDLERAGVRCRIARSADDVQHILAANGVPLHATMGGGFFNRRIITDRSVDEPADRRQTAGTP